MTHLHVLLDHRGAPGHYLGKLLRRGRSDALPESRGTRHALARLFGLEVSDLAALAYAAEGGAVGASAWFCADPVHMLAGMHSLTLFDARHLQLNRDDADALVAALNRHFTGEVEFLAPQPSRWYARFAHPLAVDVPSIDRVAGGCVELGLVAGPDAGKLQRTAMEIQMLLHEHPVNQAREARGAASVNALWLWGGGVWRAPVAAFDHVLTDDFIARAVAAGAGIAVADLPSGYTVPAGQRTLALLDGASDLDRDWFEPALRALQRGRLDSLEITLAGEPSLHLQVDRRQALRFWRR